jgi:hypothetical protein
VKVLVVVLILTLAATMSAAERLEPVSFGVETVADVLGTRPHAGRTRATVVGVDWETYAFLIPAAGSVQGNFGTYFRSDVTLANRRSTPQIVSLTMACAWREQRQ